MNPQTTLEDAFRLIKEELKQRKAHTKPQPQMFLDFLEKQIHPTRRFEKPSLAHQLYQRYQRPLISYMIVKGLSNETVIAIEKKLYDGDHSYNKDELNYFRK